jgi:hypothetical protein
MVSGTCERSWPSRNTISTIIDPHQGRSLRPPLHDAGEVIDMTARIHRRKTVTGLSEYRRAA